MNKKMDKLLKFIAIGCCTFAIALIIVLQQNNVKIQKHVKSANAIAESYTSTESNSWDISATENDSVTATLDENGLLTISGTGAMKDWLSIGKTPWASVRQEIKSVKIEDGITNIGNSAFEECWNLKSVEMPNDLNSIGESAFNSCSDLNAIEIPNTVTIIGDFAFYYCYDLTYIEIPSSVISIGENSFTYCPNLKYIEVNENNPQYKDDDGVLYNKSGTEIIVYPAAKEGREYTILSTTQKIGDGAFRECTRLNKIEIPNTVTTIGELSFSGCNNLTYLEIPNSVTQIGGDGIFCPFNGVIITEFINTNSNMIKLPNILKRTQDETDILYTSEDFALTNCTIEEGKIKINSGASFACIEIKSGKLSRLKYVLSNNSWDISEKEDKSVIATLAEDGTLTISGSGNMRESKYNDLLWECINPKIINVKIEQGLTNVADGAFEDCYNLINIEIPASVANIGEYAFSYCYSLKNIKVHGNNKIFCDENGVLYTKDKKSIIRYPAGKEEKEYNILNGVINIACDAFGDCHNLSRIYIPNTTTNIGEYAFYDCYNLKTIEIPNSLIKIELGGFAYCETLTSIVIPGSVKEIGDEAFTDCYNLTILCYENSYAKTYAQENNIDYLIIMNEIQPKTKVQQIKQQMGSNTEYKIINKNGEIITGTTYVTTGCKVESSDGENYIIIVTGDTNGDGQAEIKDILAINKHRLNKSKLQAEELLAGDVNGDGTVDIKDIMQINKFRLGKIKEL